MKNVHVQIRRSVVKTILVAHDQNLVISFAGEIPWSLPEDLKRFKNLTWDQVVLMGRVTWESLPIRPLPHRQNIIISRSTKHNLAPNNNTCIFHSLEFAIQYAEDMFPDKEIFIIGGGQIYKTALDEGLVDRIIVSKVHGKYKGDTFFPKLGDEWKSKLIEVCEGFDVIEFIKSKLYED